jgi:type I restriction enzyme S subunit
MQTGRDKCIRIGLYTKENPAIVSPAYTTFEIKRNDLVLPEYFFMLFLSKEMDRYGWFLSDSSVRSNLDWPRFCNIRLKLPSSAIQQKTADVYNALNTNLTAYTDGLADLKTTCQAYIEKLAREYHLEEIGKYIAPCKVTNSDELYGLDSVKGISIQKRFIETKANMEDVSLKPYIIVEPNVFAFVPTTSRNGGKITIALNQGSATCAVSSSYEVFKIVDTEALVPEYLFLWLNRPEFDRFARYHSWGSAREVFTFSDMCNVQIPIPPREIQQSIVDIYHAQYERQEIADSLNKSLREICPVLISHSLAQV